MTMFSNTIATIESGEYLVTVFNGTTIRGGFHLTVRVVSRIEDNAVGHTIQIGRNITVELLEGQDLREIIITFWHEMVEIAAINGASQAIALSHSGIEATAVALADLYGAPTFRVLNLALEALGL